MGASTFRQFRLALALVAIVVLLSAQQGGGQKAPDGLRQSESLMEGSTLVSGNNRFVVGFYSLPSSVASRRYLALKYVRVPDMVWIANRDSPITASGTASLNLTADGSLGLYLGASLVLQLWKSTTTNNVSLQLLDTGNLVVKDVTAGTMLWQSFDRPSDSLLPTMKVRLDLRTGESRNLSAWRSHDDPSVGDVFYLLRRGPYGAYEIYTMSPNGTVYYRPGPWNGARFSGNLGMQSTLQAGSFKYYFTITQDEVAYSTEPTAGDTTVTRLQAVPEGKVVREVWDFSKETWSVLWTRPTESCDYYAKCGPNGFCDNGECGCLQGFEAVRNRDAQGTQLECRRTQRLPCDGSKVQFLQMKGVKLPDTLNATVDRKMSLADCASTCRNDCGCTAYALDNSTGTGIGCIRWYDDLLDMRKMGNIELDVLYLKIIDSESNGSEKKGLSGGAIAGITVGSFVGFLILLFFCWKLYKKCGPDPHTRTVSPETQLPAVHPKR